MSELSREQVNALRHALAAWDDADKDDAVAALAPTVAAMLDEARAEDAEDAWEQGYSAGVLDERRLNVDPGRARTRNPYRPSAAAGAPLTASEQSGGPGAPGGADEAAERRKGRHQCAVPVWGDVGDWWTCPSCERRWRLRGNDGRGTLQWESNAPSMDRDWA